MFESTVLGVDPGLAKTGLAVLGRRGRTATILWTDTVLTAARTPEADRLRIIGAAVREAIASFRPGSVGVERVMFGNNKLSALSVARATGVIMMIAAEAGLPVEEYVPLEVKSAVTGLGSADKHQVRDALIRVHGLSGVPRQPDAVDAVAVALCHLTRSRLRALARTATP
ncbi:MAG: crossover junction endodeoxyribonuclease RuvC [Actinomycetota bacterium]